MLFCCLVIGCEKNEKTVIKDEKTKVIIFPNGGELCYKTVTIEGTEYYISRTYHGHWVIGPKKQNEKLK